jgi:Predicted branched-chain amino acid permeases (azaleucine resistance)
MTYLQQVITIGLMSLAVIMTRLLPFLLFPSKERTPHFVRFLGKYLASAVFGMLVVYCIKDHSLSLSGQNLSRFIGVAACVLLHLWRKNLLLTIAGGTVVYMSVLRYLA